MADSQGKTGEETIGALSKEMLLVAYDNEDITKDYEKLRERLEDPNTSNRDFAMLLRLAWDFRLPKPKQAIGIEADMPIQITINEGIIDDGKTH